MEKGWRSRARGISRKLVLDVHDQDGKGQWNAARGWTFKGQLELWGFDPEAIAELRSLAECDGFHEVDSIEDLAGRIVGLIDCVTIETEGANADAAARWALDLGATIREFQIKLEHDPAVLLMEDHGPLLTKTLANIAALRDASTLENKKRHDAGEQRWAMWNGVAARIWAAKPRLSKTAVARLVKQELKLDDTIKTIRDRLKKAGEAV